MIESLRVAMQASTARGRGIGSRLSRAVARSVWCVAVLLLAACSEAAGPGDPIDQLPRELTVVEQEIISQTNAFGFELLRETVTRDDRPNIVLSPLSASMALGMTLNGATNETFDAMRDGLSFGALTQEEINEAYRELIDLLTTLDPAVRFDIANAIWANEDVPFHDEFLQTVEAAFEAATESSDFEDPATLEAINAWVDEKTDGLIEKILEQLDPDLAMLLLNAIFFDGAWTTQFDPADTRTQSFTLADASMVDVEMMSISDEEFSLGAGDGYFAAELPYGGEAFSMVVVVPRDGVRSWVSDLDGQLWSEVVGGLTSITVDQLSIPKFTLSYDAYLNEPLKAMGMEIAFDPRADFSGMSPIGDRMCIDFVRQKTFIEVDERGTRAAAVTAVGIGIESFIGLIADRPFLFAIRERFSGTILFLGIVGDPTAEDPGPEDFQSTCF